MSQSSDRTSITAADAWVLSSEELATLSDKALDGDWEAADRMAMFYETFYYGSAEADYWIRIAAENGMPLWTQGYGIKLGNLGGSKNCRRAVFWLRKAAEAHGGETGRGIEDEIAMMQRSPGCGPIKPAEGPNPGA